MATTTRSTISRSFELWLTRAWFKGNPFLYLLWPFGKLYEIFSRLRYQFNKKKLKPGRFRAPVIVVGNITVGGSGKTPCIMALAQLLKDKGLKPGIVTRGYGGKAPRYPYLLTPKSTVEESGDEALLLFRELACPVVVDPDRFKAVSFLLKQCPEVNVVFSDDGLQHYGLPRDIEIAVVDASRRFGNGWCLPAGPLREPLDRLESVDMVMAHGEPSEWPAFFTLKPERIVSIIDPNETFPVDRLLSMPVHGVAAIGNPERFFETLRSLDLEVIPHPFPDHDWLTPEDLDYNDSFPIIMTAKDAVKCEAFAGPDCWYLKVRPVLSERAQEDFLRLVSNCLSHSAFNAALNKGLK